MPDSTSSFDIDRYLNHLIPRSRISHLPKPISWFLGHRSTPQKPIGNILIWFWAFIGAFASILVIEAVFQSPQLKSDGAPIVIASLGAAAILEFSTIDSPLSQPRNAFFGQLISSLIGVSITKLFALSPSFSSLRWVSGALSVGLASALMGVTKTIHPPAGATALLAATSPEIERIGWFLVALVVLGSALMLAVACLLNNLQRRFPLYWWTPEDLRRSARRESERGDVEAGGIPKAESAEKAGPDVCGEAGEGEGENEGAGAGAEGRIVILGDRVVVPHWVSLDAEEKAMLELLRAKLGGEVPAGRLERARTRESEQTHVQ
ncbi:hypothetical protein LZ554_002725 [Drepanopeziza brunnea f. sp. 'monogermtubi']|nr:hypothetical protein LZ554_002725 [Drepanopeziza brunnea f. sp. 'monogermtubi']